MQAKGGSSPQLSNESKLFLPVSASIRMDRMPSTFSRANVPRSFAGKFDPMTGLKNKDYAAHISAMQSRLDATEAVLVYVDDRMWSRPRLYLPTDFDLRAALPLRLIELASDGSIYGTEQKDTTKVGLPRSQRLPQ